MVKPLFYKQKKIDLQITADVETLFNGTKSGHLSYLHYGDSVYEGDNIQGAQQWINLQKYPDYYLCREELELVAVISKAFSTMAISPNIVDLGTGDGENVINKTIPLIKDIPAETYCAVDFSETYAQSSAKIVREALGIKTETRSFNFMDPQPNHRFSNALLLMLGSTITNIATGPNAQSTLMQLTRECLNLRRLIKDSGQILLGFDTNQNKAELDKAYMNAPHARMSEDVLWRIIRDTDFELDPTWFEYRGQWIPQEHRYAQLLVARQDCVVTSPRGVYRFKKGQTLNIDNSYKFPVDMLIKAATNAGWQPIQSWTNTGRVVYMLLHAA